MKTILLAEDNKNFAALCKQELEDDGYRVLLAHDGEEAFHLVRDEIPHIVILDIAMPGVDGLQALRWIREVYPDIPVILFTSHDEDCVKDQRARLATACVEKSGDLTELRRAIVRMMACKSAHGSIHLGLPK